MRASQYATMIHSILVFALLEEDCQGWEILNDSIAIPILQLYHKPPRIVLEIIDWLIKRIG
jgi:hypothetical protein